MSPGLAVILSPTVDPTLLELFLVHFCAAGVHMTEPVEGWIRRAGERCVTYIPHPLLEFRSNFARAPEERGGRARHGGFYVP